jgi:hypothetical protein
MENMLEEREACLKDEEAALSAVRSDCERYLVEFEEEAAEKMRQRFANSQAELANSQAETAAANERLASLEEQLWRAKSQEESERLRAELGTAAQEYAQSEEHLRAEANESAELAASLDAVRQQLLQAESRHFTKEQTGPALHRVPALHRQVTENLSVALEARDRSLEEQASQLQILRSELQEIEEKYAETSCQLSLEEQRCERARVAYKNKNISFHRCKDALIARTEELNQVSQELQKNERRYNRLGMAAEDRDVVDKRCIAAVVGASLHDPHLLSSIDPSLHRVGPRMPSVSIGRVERPLLQGFSVDKCDDTKSDVILPAVTQRLTPRPPKSAANLRTKRRPGKRRVMAESGSVSSMSSQVFSSWMLVPLRR